MNLPKQPKQGDFVLHFAEESIKWMRSNTLNHVKGGKLKRSPNGTTLEIEEQKGISLDSIIALLAHPWKCTANGDDTVTISPGFTLGTISQESPGLSIIPSFALLKPLDTYPGGTVTVTENGYIVGYVAFSSGTIVYETEGLTSVDAEYVPINTVRLSVGSGVNVEFSPIFPDGTITGNYYFTIAKVSLIDGVAVVDDQYLHHNPTLDIYIVDASNLPNPT